MEDAAEERPMTLAQAEAKQRLDFMDSDRFRYLVENEPEVALAVIGSGNEQFARELLAQIFPSSASSQPCAEQYQGTPASALSEPLHSAPVSVLGREEPPAQQGPQPEHRCHQETSFPPENRSYCDLTRLVEAFGPRIQSARIVRRIGDIDVVVEVELRA